MRRLILPLLIAAGAAFASAPALAQAIDESAVAAADRRVLDDYIRPQIAELRQETLALANALDGLCEEPSGASLEGARGAFGEVVRGWARLRFLRLAPFVEDHRLERFHFWPDPRGIGLRQVQGLLAEKDETATEAASLAGKSVALQGLGALEFVLFGTDAEALAAPGADFRCRYGSAIGGNLSRIALNLQEAFAEGAPFPAIFTEPGPQNPAYRDHGEAAEDLLNNAGATIELLKDNSLGRALGESAETAHPKRAIFWRSDLTTAHASSLVAGIGDMLAVADFKPALAEQQRWVSDSLAFEIANVESALAGASSPFTEAVRDEKQRAELMRAAFTLRNVRDLVATALPQGLGIQLGFNALDGD
ncbi:imelysin family protein [Afifella sp. IM 167]|uniref:imelysin family protein n=1 Tax=Afifella sp. IM 167 TaxID=2033586 RepID=UPI001CCDB61E|nr:imelysin family protein [Afifella sp. IM 167]